MSLIPLRVNSGSTREPGLDAVRAGALLLGLVLHSAIAFLPWSEFFWVAPHPDRSLVLSVVFWCVHLFRMSVFFLLAGYFACRLLEHRGVRGFLADRGRRIGLVLLLAWPVIHLLLQGLGNWSMWMRFGEQGPPFALPATRYTPDVLPLAHLWFLWVLLLLYVGMLALRGLYQRLDPGGRSAGWWAVAVRCLCSPVGPLLLALPLAWAFWCEPAWYAWFGVPTPDHGLWPKRVVWVAYGLAFGLGWGICGQSTVLLAHLRKTWPWHLAVSAGMATWALSILGPAPFLAPAAPIPQMAWYALAYAWGLWSATLGCVGLAVWLWRRPSPRLQWMADAAYWVYLVHLPVAIALQVLVAAWGVAWPIAFPVVLGGTALVSFASYQWLVRNRRLDRWLGRRPDLPSAATERTQAAG